MKLQETNSAAELGGEKPTTRVQIRRLTFTAMLSALAFCLMYLEVPAPLMPAFIKLDISDFPALVAAFLFGPFSGAAVCLIKNLIHLPFSSTGGVGELANFTLGILLVIPAGFIYKFKKTKSGAVIATSVGALVMAAGSFFVNYFILYPVYYNFLPQEAVLNAYQKILPSVSTIPECLLIFNVPFTFIKAAICAVIVFVLYKPLSAASKAIGSR